MSNSRQILQHLHSHRITVFLVLTLALLVTGFLNFNQAEAPEKVVPLPDHDITISLTVADVYTNESFIVSEGDTLLDALAILDALDPELELETKYYEGLGALITGMYGLTNGTDNLYWQYEINDVMPQIGASEYELKPDDAVYWKFTESAY